MRMEAEAQQDEAVMVGSLWQAQCETLASENRTALCCTSKPNLSILRCKCQSGKKLYSVFSSLILEAKSDRPFCGWVYANGRWRSAAVPQEWYPNRCGVCACREQREQSPAQTQPTYRQLQCNFNLTAISRYLLEQQIRNPFLRADSPATLLCQILTASWKQTQCCPFSPED